MNNAMRFVGRFREFERNASSDIPALKNCANTLDQVVADRLAAYLDDGVPVFDVMEYVPDPLDPALGISGGSGLRSDGAWVWRQDLSHYVRKYRISVDPEFIRHAQAPHDKLSESAILEKLEEILRVAGWREGGWM